MTGQYHQSQALQFDSLTVSKNDFFALQITDKSFGKEKKQEPFLPHVSFFDKGPAKENKDEYNFFSQHLRKFHIIFINLHGKS